MLMNLACDNVVTFFLFCYLPANVRGEINLCEGDFKASGGENSRLANERRDERNDEFARIA